MGRRDFQSTVADTLPKLIEEQANTGVGSVKFSKKDKQTIGKLYFRNGYIYAIESSTYKPNVVNRIATNEYISEAARKQLLEKYDNDVANLDAIKYVLTYQLFPEKPLLAYIKDYFFDALDDLYQWTDVNVEWRTNDEPSVPTVPNANPNELIEKVHKRKEYLENVVGASWQTTVAEIGKLAFKTSDKAVPEDLEYIKKVILSLGDGNWTIEGISTYLGLSHFNTKIAVYQLWFEEQLDILHPSGNIISHKEEVVEPEEPEVEEPVVAAPSVIAEKPAQQQKSELFYKREVKQEEPIEEVALAEEPKQEEPTELEEEIVSNIPDELPAFTLPSENSEPRRVEAPRPTESRVSASSGSTSRISRIAQQLRQELAELKNAIDFVENHKNSIETYVTSLQGERSAAVEKLRSIDAKLAEETKTLEEKKAEIEALKTEYKESIDLTKGLGE